MGEPAKFPQLPSFGMLDIVNFVLAVCSLRVGAKFLRKNEDLAIQLTTGCFSMMNGPAQFAKIHAVAFLSTLRKITKPFYLPLVVDQMRGAGILRFTATATDPLVTDLFMSF